VGAVDFERNPDRCQWWLAHPCQDVKDLDITVDTRRVADGEHRFVVRAYDAAENVHAFTSDVVAVRNATDARLDAPDRSATARGAANGVNASDRPDLTARFARGGRLKARARFSRQVGIRGRLTDELGRPIAGGTVLLSGQVGGGPEQLIASATTDLGGAYRILVPARGPSRRLIVSYRSHLDDPAPAVARGLSLAVSAPVRLSVRPGRVRNGQSIRFAGWLAAGPVPAAGKLIEMQVQIGRAWKTFATVRARGSRGRFHFRYRFMRTYEHITYRFRALSRVESGYPYGTGASRVAKVRVN